MVSLNWQWFPICVTGKYDDIIYKKISWAGFTKSPQDKGHLKFKDILELLPLLKTHFHKASLNETLEF